MNEALTICYTPLPPTLTLHPPNPQNKTYNVASTGGDPELWSLTDLSLDILDKHGVSLLQVLPPIGLMTMAAHQTHQTRNSDGGWK